jgi:channel protein (hemolysin III family)
MAVLSFFSFHFRLFFIVHVFIQHTSIYKIFYSHDLMLFTEIQQWNIYYIDLIEQLFTFSSVLVTHHGKNSLYIYKFKFQVNVCRLLLRPTQTISTSFTVALVWTMAILGIIYQSLYHERHKWLEIFFYLIVGVFPAIVIIDMVCRHNS